MGIVIGIYPATIEGDGVALCQAFAKEQSAVFEADLAKARRITYAEWLQRPRTGRLIEYAASLIGAQL